MKKQKRYRHCINGHMFDDASLLTCPRCGTEKIFWEEDLGRFFNDDEM